MLFKKKSASAAAPAKAAPAKKESGVALKVNVATAPANGMRTITMEIPVFKTYSEAELRAAATKEKKEVLGQCDITGELIFRKKNANEIHNGERPEFDGRLVSTKFLKALFVAVNNPNTQITED